MFFEYIMILFVTVRFALEIIILTIVLFADTLHERENPSNCSPQGSDICASESPVTTNVKSEIDGEEKAAEFSPNSRPQNFHGFRPSPVQEESDCCESGNGCSVYGSKCNNNGESFYNSKSIADDYRPVFIDNVAGYPNVFHYPRNRSDDHEINPRDIKTRKRKRDLSPVEVDGCVRKRLECYSKTYCCNEVDNVPSAYKTSHSPTEQLHVPTRFYYASYESTRRDSFSHGPLSPDAPHTEIGKHFHANRSPLQVEIQSRTSGKDYHRNVHPSRASCSPTPTGSSCSSPPAPAASPLPTRSSSRPFSPSSPVPMWHPLPNSSCETLHHPYYGCSIPSPCCQRFPYYFPPPPLLATQSKTMPSFTPYNVNGMPEGYNCGATDIDPRGLSQKRTARDHRRESSSSSNANVERFINAESSMPKPLMVTKEAVDSKTVLQKANTNTQSVDLTVDENSKELTSLHGGQSTDENENILNDKAGTLKEEELAKGKSPKGRKFTCKFCGKIYISLGALKMHIRTHTLPCKCHICGKAFSRPWLLQGHIRTHTGEKPYKCHMCQRAFADRSNLRAHLQTHSDVKKYSCGTCQKTFSRMSLLLKHEEAGCLVS